MNKVFSFSCFSKGHEYLFDELIHKPDRAYSLIHLLTSFAKHAHSSLSTKPRHPEIFVLFSNQAVFHGELQSLDPKFRRGAEPVVRVLRGILIIALSLTFNIVVA